MKTPSKLNLSAIAGSPHATITDPTPPAMASFLMQADDSVTGAATMAWPQPAHMVDSMSRDAYTTRKFGVLVPPAVEYWRARYTHCATFTGSAQLDPSQLSSSVYVGNVISTPSAMVGVADYLPPDGPKWEIRESSTKINDAAPSNTDRAMSDVPKRYPQLTYVTASNFAAIGLLYHARSADMTTI